MTFDEVAGQKHIIRTLRNALSENKIAHAYLGSSVTIGTNISSKDIPPCWKVSR